MKNIFQKSAMALAVASLSVGAFAADLDYTGGGSEIVLANEVFGDGSQETLVAIPDVTFTIDAADRAIGAGETATVKFTLNKGAVFGEDLSSIDKWEAAGVTLVFNSTAGANVVGGQGAGNMTLLADVTSITVDQGGAIGDNTVTFLISSTPGTDLVSAQIAQVRVKNLTTALARGVSSPSVSLGAEFRNVDTGVTDTDTALVIFRSQDGVKLGQEGTARFEITSYAAGGERARIDVADTEFSFTGNTAGTTGANAAQDFDETNNVSFVDLGNLFVVRTDVRGEWGGGVVKKENADDFDFNGSDDIYITLSTNAADFGAFDSIYLRPSVVVGGVASDAVCTATAGAADFVFDSFDEGSDQEVRVNLQGQTTDELQRGYRLCAVADGEVAIPEQTFTATLNVEYFNNRYTESEDTLSYGAILRNGCSVTLFNLPTTAVGDDAYIRLTNVSEKPGAVRGFVWTEDGEQIDLGSQLAANLDAHATVVLHTNEGQGNGVFLGDVLEKYSALTSGRHRIVLQGAFPACEAMGLIRTPAGVLVNMTSTTYSGDESRLGEFTNGTSNTTN